MKLCGWLVLVFSFISAHALAEVSLLQSMETLDRNKILSYVSSLKQSDMERANFKQIKKLAALSQPLVSEGTMILLKDRALLWRTKKPFEMVTVFSKEGMEHYIDRQKQPANAQMNRYFGQLFVGIAKMFSGDVEPILSEFDVFGKRNRNHFVIMLKPKSDMVAKYIHAMTLEGGEHMHKMVIDETSGNRTTITMNRYAPLRTMTEEDRAYVPQ